jgi:TolA-binding protein
MGLVAQEVAKSIPRAANINGEWAQYDRLKLIPHAIGAINQLGDLFDDHEDRISELEAEISRLQKRVEELEQEH